MSSFQSNSPSNYREEIPEFEVILNKIENILLTEEVEEGGEPAAEQKDDPIDYDESMMSTHYDIDAYQEYLQCIEECNANDTTAADQVVPMTFEEWQVMNYDASFEEAEDEYEAEEEEEYEYEAEEEDEESRKEEAFEVYKQGKIDDMFCGRRR